MIRFQISGIPESVTCLITQHRHLPANLAKRLRVPPHLWDEVTGVGLVALCEAAQRFDAARGAKFLTYCYRRVEGAMRDRMEYRYNDRQRNSREGALAVYAHDTSPSLEDAALAKEILGKLPERDRRLLSGFYLHDRTQEDVGAELGFSKAWTTQLFARALARARGIAA